MPVTIADVAAHAGVSKTTVSRVLNGKGEINEGTAVRVRQAIAELGYVPSAGAVGLARGRTQLVGMLVPSLTWPWIGDVLQGAIDVLETEGFGLRLLTCDRGEESLRKLGSQVAAKSFDGLLVIEPEGTLGHIAELYRAGLPVVLIDDRGNEPLFPSVTTTNRAGGAQAARHLLELDRLRPLVVTGPEHFGCARERLGGFAEVYAEAGITIDRSRLVCGEFTFDGGQAALRQALADGVSFDAVFAHNDESALGAMRVLREAGLKVPQDVSVVGFDDVALASYSDPALTTVRQPLREMGEAAAGMLLGHFRGVPLSDAPHTIPTTLTVRGTTQERP